MLRGLEGDEHLNQLERIANYKKDLSGVNKTDYFICLYDCCYYILTYVTTTAKDSFCTPEL